MPWKIKHAGGHDPRAQNRQIARTFRAAALILEDKEQHYCCTAIQHHETEDFLKSDYTSPAIKFFEKIYLKDSGSSAGRRWWGVALDIGSCSINENRNARIIALYLAALIAESSC